LAFPGKLGCRRRLAYRGARLVRLVRLLLNAPRIRPGRLFSLEVSICDDKRWKVRMCENRKSGGVKERGERRRGHTDSQENLVDGMILIESERR